jgi:hypothetical protein
MDIAEALDIQISRTKHERYRELCDPSHPDHAAWQSHVIIAASSPWPPVPPPVPLPAPAIEPPSLMTRVATAATAAVTFVASGFEVLTEADVQARLAVCNGCEQRTGNGFCAGCGCYLAAKARLPHEVCPIGKWPVSPA